ncbi:MAG TPA: hypothetical protein VLH18_09085 [Candidatus Limnocylindrales bacterium]|nr:hypothetical protein [Candidatus Limnocylindrales bacterium]
MKRECDILLCDLDAFYASVEQLGHPELRGKPVIVGGDPAGRSVVSTCSYEARRVGVRTAMPMKKALAGGRERKETFGDQGTTSA